MLQNIPQQEAKFPPEDHYPEWRQLAKQPIKQKKTALELADVAVERHAFHVKRCFPSRCPLFLS